MSNMSNKSVVVAITNHKGGVGKSTSVLNLADAFARDGFKVLVIDADPQANATNTILGDEPLVVNTPTLGDLLLQGVDAIDKTVLAKTGIKGVSLIPANIRDMGIEEQLKQKTLVPHKALAKVVPALKERFEVILIDTPPNLFLMPTLALVAADYFFVPIASGDSFSIDGLSDLMDVVRKTMESDLNPNLKFGGGMLTRHNETTSVNKFIKNMAIQRLDHFNARLLNTAIPNATVIQKAQTHGQTVLAFDRKCNASRKFAELANEMATVMDIKPATPSRRNQAAEQK